jgi:glycosyltransferase involved in cell wall biosynthesis
MTNVHQLHIFQVGSPRSMSALLKRSLSYVLTRKDAQGHLGLSQSLLSALKLDSGVLGALAQRVELRRKHRRRRRINAAGTPKVSIVIAARNAATGLKRCVTSLREQSYSELEIIVVDDASRDETLRIARSLSLLDERVRVLSNDRRRGAAASRNVGIAAATGEFLAFQDADDVSHPKRIEKQLASLLEHPRAVVCVCDSTRMTPTGERATVNGRRFDKSSISMMLRLDPVVRSIGFMLNLPVAEELEYYERVCAFFGRDSEVHLPEELYAASFSPDSEFFSSGELCIDRAGNVSHSPSKEFRRLITRLRRRTHKISARQIGAYVGRDHVVRCSRQAIEV